MRVEAGRRPGEAAMVTGDERDTGGEMERRTWEELAAASLARQFPLTSSGRTPDDVAEILERIGPIQSQTARSVHLGLAARLPGVSRDAITAAYEDGLIVRGSSLRGTVHTSTGGDHVLLEVATRAGQRALWVRTLRLQDRTVEAVWDAIEAFARDGWRTPEELRTHLRDWLDRHDPGHGARLDDTAGRYFAFGHAGLIRRPLRGGWAGQGAPGYRTAWAVLGDRDARAAAIDTSDQTLAALVRRHPRCHGPAGRHDIAWWSGLGLRAVDAALAANTDLVTAVAPDGREVHDVPDAPPPHPMEGVRLLPEFDALLCAYDPPARARFVDPEHYDVLWRQENGLLLAPLLVDGRLTGHWRAAGTGDRRACEVTWFAGTRRPRKDELRAAMDDVALAYGITWTGLDVSRG